jgi:sulfur carrier protein ThiS
MKVELKLFASLSKYLPAEAQRTNRLELLASPDTTVRNLIDRFKVPPELCSLVLVNGTFVPPSAWQDRVLVDGDVLAIWPPVAGG